MRTKNSVVTVDHFFPKAPQLRSFFDDQFKDPLKTQSKRFVWDHWYVPDQYNMIRTPAYHYFPKKTYNAFHNALLKFGRETLGCYDVSPPWLSYYVDGCSQNLHADIPHGPWAFVYSLTRWPSREFSGGETFILKSEALNYWSSFTDFNGVGATDLIQLVPPNFNRLTLFDPRLPHGVKEVKGTRDPLKSRIVIHGWFKDPEPYVVGALTRKKASLGVNQIFDRLESVFRAYSECHGTMSLGLRVSAKGDVQSVRFLTNTITALDGDGSSVGNLTKEILRESVKGVFPKADGPSSVTIPLLFRV